MEIAPIPFYIFATLAIAFALMVILLKSPISSAFSLVMVFFSFGGIYALMNAHLIAALQIVVYTGAVMVLFVFVIMLLNAGTTQLSFGGTPYLRLGVAIGCVFTLALFIWAFRSSQSDFFPLGGFDSERIEALGGNTRVLSELMFSEYILPFELTSILLLAAIVGTVAIAMRKKPKTVKSKSRLV